MIDFIKGEIVTFDESKLDVSIEIIESASRATGELKLSAVFHCMTLKIFPSGRAIIQGSLHKFYNSLQGINAPNQVTEASKAKGFNGNSFSYSQLCYSIDELCKLLGVTDEQIILRNVEIGLNIQHNYKTNLIVSNLIRHNGSEFVNPKQYFYQAEHAQFFVKCYDKAWQYSMQSNIMRYELKYVKMKELNRLQLVLLSDFKNKAVLSRLNEVLVNRWHEVLLYDYTIRISDLKGLYRKHIDKYRNKDFWNHDNEPNQLTRHKRRLQEITDIYSESLQCYFENRIVSDWQNLLNQ